MATTKKSDVEVLASTIVSKLDATAPNEKSKWKSLKIGGIVGQGQVLQTPSKDKVMVGYGLRGGKYFTVYGIDIDELRRKCDAQKVSSAALGYDQRAKYWEDTMKALDAEPTKSKITLIGKALHQISPGVKTSGGDI